MSQTKNTENQQAAAEKAPAKKTVKKAGTAAKVKTAPKAEVHVQYLGKDIITSDLAIQAKQAFVDAGNKASEAKDIKIYVKPEEAAAYYVINESFSGKIIL